MLLDKEIEMSWSNKNKDWYISKGYKFTKIRDKFKVKQKDLSLNCNKKIEYRCDYCGRVFERCYSDYTASLKESIINKDCCQECKKLKHKESMINKYGVEHQLQVKEIRNKITESEKKNFNDVIEEFEKRNYKLISNKEDYKNARTKLKYMCNKHKDFGIQECTYDNLKQNHVKCKCCALDESLEKNKIKYKNIMEDRGYIFIDLYRNSKNKYIIKFKCKKHIENGIQETPVSGSNNKCCCKYCREEITGRRKRVPLKEVGKAFNYKGYKLISNLEQDYHGNSSKLKYICLKHQNLGVQETTYASVRINNTCSQCIKDNISGKNHYLWKGGISPLHNYIRDKIHEWKYTTLKLYNYKCAISEERKDIDIHHFYGFSMILDESLEYLKLDVRDQVNKYTQEELDAILNKVIELHKKYGVGIVVCKEIHKLFHSIYGTGNNTKEQFLEFIKRYFEKEFDKLLDNQYKSINSKTSHEEVIQKIASFYYAEN